MKTSGEALGGSDLPAGGRVERLAARYDLSAEQTAQLTAILAVLAKDDRAPTTVRDPVAAVDVHLADSLAALDLDILRRAGVVADIGAGAGFPGLPLAVALPMVEMRLVESHARKCNFMAALCAAAGIGNAQVQHTRVEDWGDGNGAHDAVLARAVASQPVVLEYAAPLLRAGATLIDWRGRRDAKEEQAAAAAAAELGLELLEIVHVDPYEGAREHHLHLYRKVTPTPPRFPRRPGIARKRPLGL